MTVSSPIRPVRADLTMASAKAMASPSSASTSMQTFTGGVDRRPVSPAARDRSAAGALGRLLRSMPATEAAWLAGEITEAHVDLLARTRLEPEIGRASCRERV